MIHERIDIESIEVPKGVCKVLSQKTVVDTHFKFLEDRMNGNYTKLESFSPQLDKALGYIEANTTMLISARSGGGKSTLSKRLSTSIINNYEKARPGKVECLSFNFEMVAHKTIGRQLSNMSNVSLDTLYSKDEPLDPNVFKSLLRKYKSDLLNTPMTYVEEPATYDQIGHSVMFYWNLLCREDKKLFIVEIDHVMITKGKDGDLQKDKIDKVMDILNVCKKRISSMGGEVVFLVLSQMNRDIISKERLLNPQLHYPNTSDLFGSSAIEFYSDYIIIANNPSRMNIRSYTDQQLPTTIWDNDMGRERDMIYFHILKNRDGEPDRIVPYISKLHRFDFEEIDKPDFIKYHNDFKATGQCTKVSKLKLNQ